MKVQIQTLAKQIAPEIVKHRRHLHAHPELSFKEFNTARYIADVLRNMGLEPEEGIAGTGVVALIRGKNPDKKCTALRADIDALPITEENEVSYKSTNQGIMHACGHDVHSSSLLGVAYILNEIKDQFEGTVKLIFQPGEEKAPGGASKMIEEGVLNNPRPQHILGQHVMPYIPVGKVGFKEGVYMASADEIYLTVKGKGGHGAMPDKTVDPIVITSHIIVALQQIVSRKVDPKLPSVLTFGKIQGLGATNIIPSEVKIDGTFRTLNEKWRFEAHEHIRKMASGIAESMGATCEVDILKGYPFLENDEELTDKSKQLAKDYLGEGNVIDLDIWMAAEDFAYYSQEMDACFYRLGTRNESKGIVSGVHTPTFDIDEEALEIGPGLMAWITLNLLNEK
ncbi:MAG TPA: amidohydrolase [Cytophagales bacterium]|nr:amidohydrolase [Cytophagales bacterium]